MNIVVKDRLTNRLLFKNKLQKVDFSKTLDYRFDN